MAGEFWTRITWQQVSVPVPPGKPYLPADYLHCLLCELCLGSDAGPPAGGTITKANAATKLNLAAGSETTEFNNLVDSINSIAVSPLLGLDLFGALHRRELLIVQIRALGVASGLSWYYLTGEAMRLRIKALVQQHGGSLVGSLAA